MGSEIRNFGRKPYHGRSATPLSAALDRRTNRDALGSSLIVLAAMLYVALRSRS